MVKIPDTYTIKTSHIYPPIPIRDYDWCAYLDGYEECSFLYGWGKTRDEAIVDLNQIIEECRDGA